MTSGPGRAPGRWARDGDALVATTGDGAVALAGDARAATTLSPLERAVWDALAVPAPATALAELGEPPAVRRAIERLLSLGLVREVP
ncbi:MAG: hypothetical protein C0P77_010155 [Thermoanaerobacterales bacterium]|nr:hypothetical protein [Thermoanaerobacterales bacterium]